MLKQAEPGGMRGRWYALLILTTALMLSYVDRYLMAILVQPIERDLHLSDTQMGLLTGFAFVIFYAFLGLPIARFADRGMRRNVIVASVFIWSVVTALCGLVQNFVQMVLARLGVAVGEAGLIPTSQSMLTDLFPPTQRSTALAIFMSGGTAGLMVALIAGSRLEAAVGWRWTFATMIVPGILLALLIAFTVKEPNLGQSPSLNADNKANLDKPIRTLWGIPEYRHIPFAQSAGTIYIFAQTQWLPSFIERSFGVSRIQIGQTVGLSLGLATIAGGIAGGIVADRLARHGELWRIRLILISLTIGLCTSVTLYLTKSLTCAYFFAAVSGFFLSVPVGPFTTFTQTIVPPHMRATAASVALMVASVLGLGGGPFIIGYLSDHFAPRFGPESLRYALLATVTLAICWGLFHFTRIYFLLKAKLASTDGIALVT